MFGLTIIPSQDCCVCQCVKAPLASQDPIESGHGVFVVPYLLRHKRPQCTAPRASVLHCMSLAKAGNFAAIVAPGRSRKRGKFSAVAGHEMSIGAARTLPAQAGSCQSQVGGVGLDFIKGFVPATCACVGCVPCCCFCCYIYTVCVCLLQTYFSLNELNCRSLFRWTSVLL